MKVKELQALLNAANPESDVCVFQHMGAVVTDQIAIRSGEHFIPTDRLGLFKSQEGEYIAIGEESDWEE